MAYRYALGTVIAAAVGISLQGCGSSKPSPTPAPTPAACVPMTDTDPCFEKCHPGMKANCTAEICKDLGKIGCDGAQCVLMGTNDTADAHCMTPKSPTPSPTPSPSPSPTPSPSFKCGFFVDPKHEKASSFAGARMIADVQVGGSEGSKIALVGSDDGTSFWTLWGTWTDKKAGNLTVDFSPKGGPKDLSGVFTADNITWEDGNHWRFDEKPPFELATATDIPTDIGGLYMAGYGVVMISDIPLGTDLVAIACTEPTTYAVGTFVNKTAGDIEFPVAGLMNGTFSGNTITWASSGSWIRQVVKKAEVTMV